MTFYLCKVCLPDSPDILNSWYPKSPESLEVISRYGNALYEVSFRCALIQKHSRKLKEKFNVFSYFLHPNVRKCVFLFSHFLLQGTPHCASFRLIEISENGFFAKRKRVILMKLQFLLEFFLMQHVGRHVSKFQSCLRSFDFRWGFHNIHKESACFAI